MANEIGIAGGSALDEALKNLAPKLQMNVMRAALHAGARVIATEAKRLAPVGPPSPEGAKLYGGYAGALRDSVRVSTKIDKGGKILSSVKVGGKSRKGADVFYAHMVEFGARPHSIKKGASLKSGKLQTGKLHPGTRPHPFVRPAFDAKAGAAVEAVAAKIRERLTKEGIDSPAPIEQGTPT